MKLYLILVVLVIIFFMAISWEAVEFVFACVFILCVHFLQWLGKITHTGYIGINVIIFCIILPIYLVYLIVKLLIKNWRIRKLTDENKKLLNELNEIQDCLNKKEQDTNHLTE